MSCQYHYTLKNAGLFQLTVGYNMDKLVVGIKGNVCNFAEDLLTEMHFCTFLQNGTALTLM